VETSHAIVSTTDKKSQLEPLLLDIWITVRLVNAMPMVTSFLMVKFANATTWAELFKLEKLFQKEMVAISAGATRVEGLHVIPIQFLAAAHTKVQV